MNFSSKLGLFKIQNEKEDILTNMETQFIQNQIKFSAIKNIC